MQKESTSPSRDKGKSEKRPTKRLASTATCEVCGTEFHPIKVGQRFCSHPCRLTWWRAEVQPRATKAGAAKNAELAAAGKGQAREGSFWTSEKPSSRSRKGRRDRDRAVLEQADQAEINDEDDEDQAWADRARYWEVQASDWAKESEAFNAPRGERKPLVLVGHGAQLRVHNGALVIRDGRTHYPQVVGEKRFFPSDRKLPSRIVLVDADGAITLDALSWLARHDIPLIQLDYRGRVLAVASRSMQPYDPELREAQVAATTNGTGIELATELIRHKVRGEQETLLAFWRTPVRDRGLQKLRSILRELEVVPSNIDALRIIEARAALAYFLCWGEVPIQWKGIGRKPIPDSWHRGGMRQGISMDGTNRHATHPLNAMLIYCYAVLATEVRISLVAHGFDPTIGYLHTARPGRLSLVYDVMEVLRPRVEQMALTFLRTHTFSPHDFVVTPIGVCRLHPELARRVIVLVSRDELIESVIPDIVSVLAPKASSGMKRGSHLSRTGAKRGRPSRHSAQSSEVRIR